MIDKLEKGADDYLSKPFNPREILARVNIILKAREYEKIILDKNKKILDSINYAIRIQLSILPSEDLLNKYLNKNIVIWKPKDIVGGDLYWFHKIDDNKQLLAVIDCTGHGVPGAVMTMTANSVLERIACHFINDNPAEILKYLNIITRETVKQNIQNPISNDGMDISLCYINKLEKNLFSQEPGTQYSTHLVIH